MSKILIIEDDYYLQKNIRELLHNKQYETITASTKAEGMQYILNKKDIDLFLIDLWLPDGEGFELCEAIRKRSVTPIIFLTACDDETSVVRGLDLGADDYITKPFRNAELLSRIQANLRRQKMQRVVKQYESGELRISIEKQTVYKRGEELVLRPVEYQLLCLFIKNPGVIIKRELVMQQLWDESENYIEDNTLSVQMGRLRRKIGTDYIETIRGFGYRYTKTVKEVLE